MYKLGSSQCRSMQGELLTVVNVNIFCYVPITFEYQGRLHEEDYEAKMLLNI